MNVYINIQEGQLGKLQRRLLLLPVIWGAYGIGEVFILTYLFGPILNDLPYIANDKPIGGSYFPALFFNVSAMFAMIGFSLWALGVWTIDFSSPKTRRDFGALIVLLGSGLLAFYNALFLFPLIVSLVYLMATNIQ
jgi:hypothetical protein